MSPVITKIDLTGDKDNIDSIVPNPSKCPYILKNEVAIFYFTFKGKLQNSVNLTINYTDSLNNHYNGKVEITAYTTTCSYINKMVDFMGINALYSSYKYE